jgi:F-type H+-transporting ATPase subunit delta
MSKDSLIVKTYGDSLFEVALNEKCLDKVLSDLESIKSLLGSDKENKKILLSNIVPLKLKKKLWGAILESNKYNKITVNLVNILLKKNRINVFLKICSLYLKLYNKHNNILVVNLTSAVASSNEQKKELVKILSNTTGSKIELVEKVDSNILGGMVINYSSYMLDCSLATKLVKLKNKLCAVKI